MKLSNMMYVSMITAFICVLGLIPAIPLPFTPVPIVIQSVGIILAGAILGPRLGMLSVGIFLLLVAIGVPVLSGGRGGLAPFVGPSAGYLFAYPFAAFLIGWMANRFKNNLTVWKLFIVNFIGGGLFLYLCGAPVTALVLNLPIEVIAPTVLTYFPGDLMKAFVAAVIAVRLRKSTLIKRAYSEKTA